MLKLLYYISFLSAILVNCNCWGDADSVKLQINFWGLVMSTVNGTSSIPLQDANTFNNTTSSASNTTSSFFSTVSDYASGFASQVNATAYNVIEVVSDKIAHIRVMNNEVGAFETLKLEANSAFTATKEATFAAIDYAQKELSYESLSKLGAEIGAQANATFVGARDYVQTTQAYEFAGNAAGKVADAISSGYETASEHVASAYNTTSEKASENFNSFSASFDKNWLPLTVFVTGTYLAGKSSYNAYTSYQNGKIGQTVRQIIVAGLSAAVAATVVHSAYVTGSKGSTTESV